MTEARRMKEARGNIWDLDGDAICVLTNCNINGAGNLVMGAGQAKEAAQRFPFLPALWGECVIETGKPSVFVTELTDPSDISGGVRYLINFPTKNDWRDDASPGLILESCVELIRQIDLYGLDRVLLPRPGCGHGGLDWDKVVQPLISKILDDRVVVVTF